MRERHDSVVVNYLNPLIIGSNRGNDKSKKKNKTIISQEVKFIKFSTFNKNENKTTLIDKINLNYFSQPEKKDSNKKLKKHKFERKSTNNLGKNIKFIRKLTSKNKPEDIFCSCYDTSRRNKNKDLDEKSLELIEKRLQKKIKEMKKDNKLLESLASEEIDNIDNFFEKTRTKDQCSFSSRASNKKNSNKNKKNENQQKILEKLNTSSSQQKLNESIVEDLNILRKINQETTRENKDYNMSVKSLLNKEKKYRNLRIKKLIYDSFDDDECIEDEILKVNIIYISPNNKYILIFDYIIIFLTLYSLIFLPINISTSICFNSFVLRNIINYFMDLVYIIDLILSFFRPYYNFEDQLVYNNNKIIFHYLSSYFVIDLICSIPFYSIFNIMYNDKNCFKINLSIKLNNLYRIFEIFKSLKCLKIMSKKRNSGINAIIKIIDYYSFFDYKFVFKIFLSLFVLHITTCLHIFISRNSIPNWIISNNLVESSYITIYFTSLYFIITTLTTVGYGDITGKTFQEIIFQIFLLIIGIMAYSWLISYCSNIIQEKNKVTEALKNKIRILDDIRMKYNKMSKEMYIKIYRHLEYTHLTYKNDPHLLIDSLPYSLKNSLLNEMYKPIIKNLNFFKNFKNSSFVLKIVRKLVPIRAYKNEILLDQGDLIENMILVKEGSLTLEIKININNPIESVNKLYNDDIFLGIKHFSRKNLNELAHNLSPLSTLDHIKNSSGNFNSSLIKDKDEKIKYLHLKILELRKNEHFGGLLLFLNRRTFLTLRVKSKKADLYFLKKIDAVEISSSYPNIWKRINKISFHNLKQISKYIKKIIKQYCNTFGIKYQVNQNSCKNSTSKNENKVKFDLTENKNYGKTKVVHNDADNNKENKPSLKNINRKNNDIKQTDENNGKIEKVLNNSVKNGNNLNISNVSNLNNSVYSNNSIEKKKSKFYKASLNSNLGFDNSNSNKKNKNILYLTPFSPEEINDEIYIGENFIPDNLDNSINKSTILKIKSHILRNITENKILSLSRNSFSIINHKYNLKIFNLLQISKNDSFEFHSLYKNINKISKYKYAKDKDFQSYIKKKLENRYRKGNRSIKRINSDIFYFKDKQNKQISPKTVRIKKEKMSISDDKNNVDTEIHYKGKEFTNVTENKKEGSHKSNSNQKLSLQMHSSNTQVDKYVKKRFKTKKKSVLLNEISQNIINDTNALNNPNEFYTTLFNSILKDRDKDYSKRKKERFSKASPMTPVNIRRSSKTFKFN